MKRKALVPILFLLLSALALYAAAAGGDSSDPLISLSYLNGTYLSTVDTAVDQRLDAADQTLAANATAQLSAVVSGAGSGGSVAANWTETRLKSGDVLSGPTGLNILLLAGSMQVTFSSGAVVDVSAGTTVSSGSALAVNHRYLTAEDTAAQYTVTSKTAVAEYQGTYTRTDSAALDYNAMAAALKTMHLFQGSYTGYGSGYDLELAPTRIQALIMFIRVLGEEDAALGSTGSTPFRDIASGSLSEKYVSYAYSRGYSNGYTATSFQPNQAVTANQYLEFLLRALGYSSTANTNLSDTLTRAQNCGVLNGAEAAALQSAAFLRADLVYVSYYGLDAPVSGSSQTLRQTLIGKGVFTAAEASAASALVSGNRLS